jgi:DNA-directed RNA polymerase specialized sigma24 family protein
VRSRAPDAPNLRPPKPESNLTPDGFNLLLATLDADREEAGRRYEEMRKGLVCFFEWRGGIFAEDHADETINRVARKLEAGETIRDPLTYVHGVARMLLLEIFKQREKERFALLNRPEALRTKAPSMEELAATEAQFECLEGCMAKLPAESKEFMKQYYHGEKQIKIETRKALAEQLGIPLNALRLRARRLRGKLEECILACLKAKSSE